MAADRTDLDQLASDFFGSDRLGVAQRQALAAVIEGHDILVIMPSGAGKSATAGARTATTAAGDQMTARRMAHTRTR